MAVPILLTPVHQGSNESYSCPTALGIFTACPALQDRVLVRLSCWLYIRTMVDMKFCGTVVKVAFLLKFLSLVNKKIFPCANGIKVLGLGPDLKPRVQKWCVDAYTVA